MNEFRVEQLKDKFDTTPHILSAGAVTDFPDESTQKCVKPDIYDPKPGTPGDIKKWRKSTFQESGKICLHPGVAEDLDFRRVGTYGVKTPMGAKVKELVQMEPPSNLMATAIAKKESIYDSSKREPLGKSYMRGHVLPDKFTVGTVEYGKPTPKDVSGNNTKELVYPEYEGNDTQGIHTLYVKSHANFAPGEQRERGYTWSSQKGTIDPKEFRFGVQGEKGGEGVMKALNPHLDPMIQKEPVVVSKVLEDFKETASEQLGKVHNLGHGDRRVGQGPNHTFGMPSQRFPEWGATECMTGAYSEEEQQPDIDLGKSIRPGWRNMTDENRPFGVPNIRRDILPPRMRSIADNQNYGGEPNAETLLYPSRFSMAGVNEEDFLEPCTLEQVQSIFEDAGFKLSNEDYQVFFNDAAAQDPSGLVSIETFRRAMNTRLMMSNS